MVIETVLGAKSYPIYSWLLFNWLNCSVYLKSFLAALTFFLFFVFKRSVKIHLDDYWSGGVFFQPRKKRSETLESIKYLFPVFYGNRIYIFKLIINFCSAVREKKSIPETKLIYWFRWVFFLRNRYLLYVNLKCFNKPDGKWVKFDQNWR